MAKWKEKIYSYEVVFGPNGVGYTITVPKFPPGLSLKEIISRKRAGWHMTLFCCYLEAFLLSGAILIATRNVG